MIWDMRWIMLLALTGALLAPDRFAEAAEIEKSQTPAAPAKTLQYLVIPVRDDIMKPMAFLVRRGVKLAMEKKADLLVIDMDTNGGRVDVTEEIIEMLGQFKGQTVTYVNRKAFSAGAFIAVATQRIYMADQSVIGAAAPIMMTPGGGADGMPDTVERKMTSGISALVRTRAEKNGHNAEVLEAMVDKTKELKIGDKVINEKGRILTLTNLEAEKSYGDPAKPLLSSGTKESLELLLRELGYGQAHAIQFSPTGAEKLATWLTALNPLLLILGVAGLYLEFKTPGFGLPGIVGITSFVLYFLGGYLAGLSGLEAGALFVLGALLFFAEFFLFPGTLALGLGGAFLMFVAVVMAMMDFYPGAPALPSLPKQLGNRAMDLVIAMGGSVLMLWFLARFFPSTPLYHKLVSSGSSGTGTAITLELRETHQPGTEGVALSTLRPGGKGQFGDDILDVLSEGEMIPKGARIRIVRFSGAEAVVEPA